MPSVATTTSPTTTTTTVVVPSTVDPATYADISMTVVPPDVIRPTSPDTLDEDNPINGRRGDDRRSPEDVECAPGIGGSCLTGALDLLGFDVTTGGLDERERRLQRATVVVQLDAGLPVTGLPDDQLLAYLGVTEPVEVGGGPDEVRQIGTSAQGRPIVAFRRGDGPRTVLVVGQTHGDEEAGVRVLLRARSLPVPDDVTIWFVPTMNPDGQRLDTRFLANGADPNRQAPTHLEQHAVHAFALEIRPTLSVWYHQNYGWIGGSGASSVPAREYHAMTNLGPLNRSGDCAKGFTWCPIDAELGASSILVELPDVVTPADVQLHAQALLDVATSDQF